MISLIPRIAIDWGPTIPPCATKERTACDSQCKREENDEKYATRVSQRTSAGDGSSMNRRMFEIEFIYEFNENKM